MWIMVVGPHTGETTAPETRAANLRTLIHVGADLYQAGHVPITDVNMTDRCHACLRIEGPSRDADEEVRRFKAAGRPVYRALHEIPASRN